MDFILSLVVNSLEQVWLAWLHNWPYLLASVAVATLLKLYVDERRLSSFLNRARGAGILAATTAAVATPLCSCGTAAVVLGMIASKATWAPIIAFMVSSPLTSPEGLFYSAGLFGWPFALALYLASIILGLAGGWVAAFAESRGWLDNQIRLPTTETAGHANLANRPIPTPNPAFRLEMAGVMPGTLEAACCGAISIQQAVPCGCGQADAGYRDEPSGQALNSGQLLAISYPPRRFVVNSGLQSWIKTARHAAESSLANHVLLARVLKEFYINGKYLLVMFTGFAFIGYFLNGLIPASWISAVFGGDKIYNVPLAATLGLPFYINSETSLPLIRALLDNGMSQGAALAFIIVGAGTSIGAVSGAMTIARWRVIALIVGVLWIGAILSGLAFNLALALKLI